MRPHVFLTEGYYHLYNRGVEKRDIFIDDADRKRFLRCLQAFNNACRPSDMRIGSDPKEFAPYLSINAYCLMNNHFHLLVQQRKDEGISNFMHKVMNSYTKYFNARHRRQGRLFESVYKSVPVESDGQLLHLTRYIHLNPLRFIEPLWKEKVIRNLRWSLAFVRAYRWSSYQYYLGRRDEPALHAEPIFDLLSRGEEYAAFVEEYVYNCAKPGFGIDGSVK